MVDAEKMGFGFEVLAFATLERAEVIDVFDESVSQVPQVIGAQRLFGEPDYLLRVFSPDLRAYQDLYDSVLVKLPGLRGLKLDHRDEGDRPQTCVPGHHARVGDSS